MQRYFLLIVFTFQMICSLQGEIIETKNFKEILNYIQHPETLIILDIDDTLLIPVQTLGTDVWFLSRLDHHLKINNDRQFALDKALAEWEAVRHLTSVKIVEEGTEEIVREMQKNNIVVMGLSTQGLALATRTVIQLKSLSIDLTITAPASQDHYFINGEQGVLYRHGILFTCGTPKGPALLTLLDMIGFCPKNIVFINDKIAHLQDLEKSAESKNINFIGLRYSYSDERVLNFNREIADIQWKHSTFNRLISDEEAASLLHCETQLKAREAS
ncbi:MAG: DUF2608 domain-containing protein [Parachlamydiaceae bacterium]|nr:DUF2608 domain-containing protein [Parachlamydiaceae bacterium]